MNLLAYLQNTVKLSVEVAMRIDELFDIKELSKGQILLNEGSPSKKVFFIEKGLLRLYYYKDGKDITQHFFDEGAIYLPIENVFLNQPYYYNLELLENSRLRTIDFSTIEKILDEDLKLQRFVRYLSVTIIKQLAEHLYSLQFHTAQDRYRILVESFPNIHQRASLGHIASYLGITQQTLSVIRAIK